jgi:hypothetical protein
MIWAVPADLSRIEPWVRDARFVMDPAGFNLNGIAASENGKYLIVVQSNTGQLFRIDTDTKEVTPIDLNGETLTNGDGILLQGRKLYVVRNQNDLVAVVRLSRDLTRGTYVRELSRPEFAVPTTIARSGGRFWGLQREVRRQHARPELPGGAGPEEVTPYSTSRRSTAQRLSSCRLESWSLRSTADTCASTVLAEIPRRSAISL